MRRGVLFVSPRREDAMVLSHMLRSVSTSLEHVADLKRARAIMQAEPYKVILTEANLGVLGLGINEPVPSWGNMLTELQNYQRIPEQPWILAPALLLVLVVGSLQFVVSRRNIWE